MPDKNVPVFVKINDYKEILDIVDVMKQKLKETRMSLDRLKELKLKENQELEDWDKNVGEISRRLSFIDSAFFDNE